jgi:hypothetical protein
MVVMLKAGVSLFHHDDQMNWDLQATKFQQQIKTERILYMHIRPIPQQRKKKISHQPLVISGDEPSSFETPVHFVFFNGAAAVRARHPRRLRGNVAAAVRAQHPRRVVSNDNALVPVRAQHPILSLLRGGQGCSFQDIWQWKRCVQDIRQRKVLCVLLRHAVRRRGRAGIVVLIIILWLRVDVFLFFLNVFLIFVILDVVVEVDNILHVELVDLDDLPQEPVLPGVHRVLVRQLGLLPEQRL